MTGGVVHSLGPGRFSKWGNLNSKGASGGIVVFGTTECFSYVKVQSPKSFRIFFPSLFSLLLKL